MEAPKDFAQHSCRKLLYYRVIIFDMPEEQTATHNSETTRHTVLYRRQPNLTTRVQMLRGVGDGEEATRLLRQKYKELLQLTHSHLVALDTIAHLARYGTTQLTDEHDEPTTPPHTILEGHRWIADALNIDFSALQAAGLVERPTLNGEPRDRLLYRRFWQLTPSGRDIVFEPHSGQGVGDPGEQLVHRLGVWLVVFWLQATDADAKFKLERYEEIDGHTYDLVQYRAGRGSWPQTDGQVHRAVEVETGLADPQSVETDAKKLGSVPGESVWVFPTKDVLRNVVTALNQRGYVGLDGEQVPGRGNELPAVEIEECQRRVRIATQQADLSWEAMTQVHTYRELARKLRHIAPEYFYPAQS